jgi:hypothetical protein
VLDTLYGDCRHLRKKPLQGVSGADLNLFHRFDGFQHPLKMAHPVKIVNFISSKGPISTNAETRHISENNARAEKYITIPVGETRRRWYGLMLITPRKVRSFQHEA